MNLRALTLASIASPLLVLANPCDSLVADFQADIIGTTVTFTPGVIDNSWSYQWDFGDGTGDWTPTTTHTYPGATVFQACLKVWTWDPLAQDTCFATSCQIIDLTGGDPCAQLQAGFFANAGPGFVQFSNATTGTGLSTSWVWSFGDGSTSNDPQPFHTYAQPGTYTVCLTAISILQQPGGGVITCVDSTCAPVIVPGTNNPCDSLNADFQFSAQGTYVAFLPQVIDNTWSYQWDFGDGTFDWGPNVNHPYPGPSVFQACLTVWTWDPLAQDTCFATSCQIIDLTGGDPCAQLQAGFFANAGPGFVQFSNATTGTGLSTSWVWSFGDGSTSNDPQPFHTYAQPGTYTVCLTAISILQQPGGGVITCVDSTCAPVIVPGTNNPCDSLNADFQFSAQGTYVAFLPQVIDNTWSYQWDFGDGTFDWGPNVNHPYPGPSVFQACLTVWTWDPLAQDTCFATSCQIIDLTGGDPCAQLQAGFFANAGPGFVQFSNATTGTGLSTSWAWSFGDGSTSNDPQPFHTYAQPGTYTVCLTAISILQQPGGGVITCVDSTCAPVIVPASSGCDSTYAATYTAMVAGSSVAFYGLSTLPTVGWSWDFGDGTSGGGQNTQHVYPGPGAYYACLTTWYWGPLGQDTCWATHCQWISIASAASCDSLFVADFEWTGLGTAIAVQNTTQANGPILSVSWDFGDGATATGGSAAHTYAGPGTYTVCLTVVGLDPWAQDSCTVVLCENVLVGGLAIGVGGQGPTPVLVPQPFTDRLVVSGLSGSTVSVELVDGTGRTVLRGAGRAGSELELNTSSLAPGAYAVMITVDGLVVRSRAVKAWR